MQNTFVLTRLQISSESYFTFRFPRGVGGFAGGAVQVFQKVWIESDLFIRYLAMNSKMTKKLSNLFHCQVVVYFWYTSDILLKFEEIVKTKIEKLKRRQGVIG